MGRFLGRALWPFALYAGVVAAVVVAGFLGQALGIWASVLWGAAVVAAVVFFIRRRVAPPAD
jgi:hypothetical protein